MEPSPSDPSAGGELVLHAPAAVLDARTRLGFWSLSQPLALLILRLLPADQRARAALVCRAWRAALSEACAWAVLDVSPASGFAAPLSADTLRLLAARAGGRLAVLNVSGCTDVDLDALLEVATANAATLRELTCVDLLRVGQLRGQLGGLTYAFFLGVDTIEALARAAPQLRVLESDALATSSFAVASSLLRKDAPFGALRLRALKVNLTPLGEEAAAVFAAALLGDAWLKQLKLCFIDNLERPVASAVWAAIEARQLTKLTVEYCSFSAMSVAAIARMVQHSLTHLDLNSDRQLNPAPLDVAVWAQLAAALAASDKLKHVRLCNTQLMQAAVASGMWQAITAHPSLHRIEILLLEDNELAADDVQATSELLGALVAANAPALHELDVVSNNMNGVGLQPMLDALAHNTHLRELKCYAHMSNLFARLRFLPAIRANASLRRLEASMAHVEIFGNPPPALLEAEALVAARGD